MTHADAAFCSRASDPPRCGAGRRPRPGSSREALTDRLHEAPPERRRRAATRRGAGGPSQPEAPRRWTLSGPGPAGGSFGPATRKPPRAKSELATRFPSERDPEVGRRDDGRMGPAPLDWLRWGLRRTRLLAPDVAPAAGRAAEARLGRGRGAARDPGQRLGEGGDDAHPRARREISRSAFFCQRHQSAGRRAAGRPGREHDRSRSRRRSTRRGSSAIFATPRPRAASAAGARSRRLPSRRRRSRKRPASSACVSSAGLPERLRDRAARFRRDRRSACHRALRPTGELLCPREDVGRHNAMDKVIGWAFARRSGCRSPTRSSASAGGFRFELVQKAARCGLPDRGRGRRPVEPRRRSAPRDRRVTLSRFRARRSRQRCTAMAASSV